MGVNHEPGISGKNEDITDVNQNGISDKKYDNLLIISFIFSVE